MSLMEKARLPVILSYRLPEINVSILANAFLKERGSLDHAGGWFKVGGFFWETLGTSRGFYGFYRQGHVASQKAEENAT